MKSLDREFGPADMRRPLEEQRKWARPFPTQSAGAARGPAKRRAGGRWFKPHPLSAWSANETRPAGAGVEAGIHVSSVLSARAQAIRRYLGGGSRFFLAGTLPGWGTGRMTSRAGLSSRTPLKTTWRSRLSSVQVR